MDHKQKGFKAVVVGLSDKTVCVYKDKFLVNKMAVPDVITAILFGRFGREDSSLVLATKGAGLLVSVSVYTSLPPRDFSSTVRYDSCCRRKSDSKDP